MGQARPIRKEKLGQDEDYFGKIIQYQSRISSKLSQLMITKTKIICLHMYSLFILIFELVSRMYNAGSYLKNRFSFISKYLAKNLITFLQSYLQKCTYQLGTCKFEGGHTINYKESERYIQLPVDLLLMVIYQILCTCTS